MQIDGESVTPFLGVWIEMEVSGIRSKILRSLPSWECGLKYDLKNTLGGIVKVTPFLGVWIEIDEKRHKDHAGEVTPFLGVWIEILLHPPISQLLPVTPFLGVWIEINTEKEFRGVQASLPSWECGLKFICMEFYQRWVRHSLLGSVD